MSNSSSRALALFDLAGGCPAATYFLLLRQKKVSKEKATQSRRPGDEAAGVPCVTRCDRPLGNSPREMHFPYGDCYAARLRHPSRTSPVASALLGVAYGAQRPDHPLCRTGLVPVPNLTYLNLGPGLRRGDTRRVVLGFDVLPIVPAEHRRRGGGCPPGMSERRAIELDFCAYSFRAASLAGGPSRREAQGTPAALPPGRGRWGRLLLLTFLGGARKGSCCRATPGLVPRLEINQARKRKQRNATAWLEVPVCAGTTNEARDRNAATLLKQRNPS